MQKLYKEYLSELKTMKLFYGIQESEMTAMLGCIGAYLKEYKKNQYIITLEENVEAVGILLSGKVEVFLPGLDKGIILKPNQKISCNKQNGTYNLAEVDASDYIIWIGDKLVCTNEKLSVVLHRMKHWYNLDIECRKGVPLDQRLSLTIRKESPEEILKLLTLIIIFSLSLKELL